MACLHTHILLSLVRVTAQDLSILTMSEVSLMYWISNIILSEKRSICERINHLLL